jgi:uncharacterized protein (UPF0335 family)
VGGGMPSSIVYSCNEENPVIDVTAGFVPIKSLIDTLTFNVNDNIKFNNDESTIKQIINEFVNSIMYIDVINSNINKNINNIYDDLKGVYNFDKDFVRKLIKSYDDFSTLRTLPDVNPKMYESKKREYKNFYTKYKILMEIHRIYDGFFEKQKKRDYSKHGQSYEDAVNQFFITELQKLNIPILYCVNVKYNEIVGNDPKVPAPLNVKGEIDGLILLKTTDEVWYPICILEMKNNINLIMDDIIGSANLLGKLAKLADLEPIKNVTIGNRDLKIDFDGFKNIGFNYCVNNINLLDKKFEIMNSTNIRGLTTKYLVDNKIDKISDKDKFYTFAQLSRYVIDKLSGSIESSEPVELPEAAAMFAKKTELSNSINRIKEEVENSFGKSDSIDDIIGDRPENVTLEIIARDYERPFEPIIIADAWLLSSAPSADGAASIDKFSKLCEEINEYVSIFEDFFSNKNHIIMHLPMRSLDA